MNVVQLEIQLIAIIVAIACAIPGVFLVLRKMAMITDAISHSILPGIVIGFLLTHNLNSPWLIALAAIFGLITVWLVEWIYKTQLVKEDTAIGLVFPALFSIGIILIARKAGDIHLDTDVVLSGELAFASFNRFYWNGMDLGPKSLWSMGSILILTLILLFTFYKELKLSTFDPLLSTTLGFSTALLHYGLMTITSITTVGAFDSVGAILVVGFMIVPAACAYLLTDDLKKMLILSIGIASLSSIGGYWIAHMLDTSISGSITTLLGIIFLIIYLFAPKRGWLANRLKILRQKREYLLVTLMLHLKNHPETVENKYEFEQVHLSEHFGWTKTQSKSIIQLGVENNLFVLNDSKLSLTEKGLKFTSEIRSFIFRGTKELPIDSVAKKFLLFRG